jgi:ribose-phosphate pyrophosphokinase
MNTPNNGHFDPVILSGYSSLRNAEAFADYLGVKVSATTHGVHPNRELKSIVGSEENLRGADVIIIASAAGTPDRNNAEAKFLCDVAWDNKARTVTVVLPYQFYGRQDSNHNEKASAAMKRVLNELCRGEERTIDRLFIFDPHNPVATKNHLSGKKVDYDSIHFAHLFARQAEFLLNMGAITQPNVELWGLDKGGVERLPESYLEAFARIGISVPISVKAMPFLDKQRDKVTGKQRFTGRIINSESVEGKDVIIAEDMVDTGGSVVDGAELLKKLGARSVTLFATAGIFSKPRDAKHHRAGIERINASAASGKGIDAIYVINSFDHAPVNQRLAKIITRSPVIHEIDGWPFAAEIVRAAFNPDRKTNSVSKRLGGDPALLTDDRIFRPVRLKSGNRLLVPAQG